MEKKITLDSKLKRYTALASGLTLVAGAAQGQVFHTDVNPDQVITGHNSGMNIDFNNDGNVDVSLATLDTVTTGTYSFSFGPAPYTLTYVGGALALPGAGSNEGWMASTSTTSSGTNTNMMNAAGLTIGGGAMFASGQGAIGNIVDFYVGAPISSAFGPFTAGMVGTTDGFIGVKFDIGGSAHYGWVRIDLSADAKTLTVKDFAYDMTADTDIIGEVPANVGVTEIVDFASIINTNNQVVISLTNGNNNADATITDLSGKQIFNKTMNSNKEVIGLNEFASGIYLVSVRSDKGIVTKRVYVK